MLLYSAFATSAVLYAGLASALPSAEGLARRDIASLFGDMRQVGFGLLQEILGNVAPGETVLDQVLHPPHKHHGDAREEIKKKTIFQALQDDPKFSKVFKAVNITDDVTKVLNDSDAKVTFFAPPNWALPSHHRNHDDDDDDDHYSGLASNECELFELANDLVDIKATSYASDEDLKKIIRAALLYHIVPSVKRLSDFATNITWATNLTIGDSSLDDEPQRIRTSFATRISPVLSVNVYAKVVDADIEAANGIVHEINHPLFPPGSVFETLFLLQDVFSTVTSAVGRLGMIDQIDYHHHSEEYFGSPTVTFFAPTNRAFRRLPKKVQLYLFSKYGQNALQKILEYHIVPGVILHSNWVHNVSDNAKAYPTHEFPMSFPTPSEPVFYSNITADSLLEGKTLSFHVVQHEHKVPLHPSLYTTEVHVNGQVVHGADFVARNGVFHVIDKLLNPHGHHHHHQHDQDDELIDETTEEDEWVGWEEWLPRWANQAA